jgi:hypothetical protein
LFAARIAVSDRALERMNSDFASIIPEVSEGGVRAGLSVPCVPDFDTLFRDSSFHQAALYFPSYFAILQVPCQRLRGSGVQVY